MLLAAWDGSDPVIGDWSPTDEATDTATRDVVMLLAAACGSFTTPGIEPRVGVNMGAGVEVVEGSCKLPGTAPVTVETTGFVMTEMAVGSCKLPATADGANETLGSFKFPGKAPVTAIEGVVVDVTVDETVNETARTEWGIPLSSAEWANGWL